MHSMRLLLIIECRGDPGDRPRCGALPRRITWPKRRAHRGRIQDSPTMRSNAVRRGVTTCSADPAMIHIGGAGTRTGSAETRHRAIDVGRRARYRATPQWSIVRCCADLIIVSWVSAISAARPRPAFRRGISAIWRLRRPAQRGSPRPRRSAGPAVATTRY
jgi:hypothetical protein